MKRFSYIVVAFMLILSSFGFLSATFMDHSVNEKCPFSILSNNDCETITDAAISLFHHISEAQSLTETLLVSTVAALMLLLLAATILFLNNFYSPHISLSKTYQSSSIIQKEPIDLVPNPILRWISLLNKRSICLKTITMVT